MMAIVPGLAHNARVESSVHGEQWSSLLLSSIKSTELAKIHPSASTAQKQLLDEETEPHMQEEFMCCVWHGKWEA